jgi:zinc-ribbon domain
MVITAKEICPNCGYENAPEAASCSLCGEFVDSRDRMAPETGRSETGGLPPAHASMSPSFDEVQLSSCSQGDSPGQLEPSMTPWLYL